MRGDVQHHEDRGREVGGQPRDDLGEGAHAARGSPEQDHAVEHAFPRSSTSRTFLSSAPGGNGFCRKDR
jgi:hypothetical protein